MVKTIGNPLSWTADALGSLFGHAAATAENAGAKDTEMPQIRTLSYDDLREALRKGLSDMGAFRSDVVFVCLLYPMLGAIMVLLTWQGNNLQLVFPVLSGFALAGPVAAVGLYEMSRRREQGLQTNWLAYIDVLRSPKFGGILLLSLFHLVIFMLWIMVANLIALATIGPDAANTVGGFAQTVFGTAAGWAMILIGSLVGFCFAAAVLAISVVSFPLLLDRNVGLPMAVITSVRVALKNPGPIAAWGLIVAGLLAIGSIPLLLGLVLVMPLLGHATWHLYRAAIV